MIDTPGMRELALWNGDSGVDETFADVAILASECRFNDCRHESEPGCAVLDAIESGTLSRARLESYNKLQRELRYVLLKRDRRAAAEERKKYKRLAKTRRGEN